MAEPKSPSASVEGKAEVEWSPHAGAGTGDPAKAGERLLEPEEIDGLLQGGRNGAQTGVEALIRNATVTYERLPMLEVVFDRLVRILTTSLRNFTSEDVDPPPSSNG